MRRQGNARCGPESLAWGAGAAGPQPPHTWAPSPPPRRGPPRTHRPRPPTWPGAGPGARSPLVPSAPRRLPARSAPRRCARQLGRFCQPRPPWRCGVAMGTGRRWRAGREAGGKGHATGGGRGAAPVSRGRAPVGARAQTLTPAGQGLLLRALRGETRAHRTRTFGPGLG